MSYFDDYEFDRFYEEEKQIQRIERNFIMNDLTNVTTGEVRLSYVHLFKPYAAMQGQEEKYSCTILVPKTDADTMGRINAAIEAAKQKGISEKWNGQCPPIVRYRSMTETECGRLMAWPSVRSVRATGYLRPALRSITVRKSWITWVIPLSTSRRSTAVCMAA